MSANLTTLALSLIPTPNIENFLKARDLPVPPEPEKAFDLALRSSGVKTQGEFSGLMVNLTEGQITGQQLTEALKAAFPSDKVGDRHGPYYLSHCRTGKIKVDFTPTKKTAAARPAPAADPRVAALELELEQLKGFNKAATDKMVEMMDRIEKALACTSLKDARAALVG